MMFMPYVIPQAPKPRIRRICGVWVCEGVSGSTPSDAFLFWRSRFPFLHRNA